MRKEVVVVLNDISWNKHLYGKMSESKTAINLAKELNKLNSVKGKVWIEQENTPETKPIGCEICDKRIGQIFIED